MWCGSTAPSPNCTGVAGWHRLSTDEQAAVATGYVPKGQESRKQTKTSYADLPTNELSI
jgi:hypothetical protein